MKTFKEFKKSLLTERASRSEIQHRFEQLKKVYPVQTVINLISKEFGIKDIRISQNNQVASFTFSGESPDPLFDHKEY